MTQECMRYMRSFANGQSLQGRTKLTEAEAVSLFRVATLPDRRCQGRRHRAALARVSNPIMTMPLLLRSGLSCTDETPLPSLVIEDSLNKMSLCSGLALLQTGRLSRNDISIGILTDIQIYDHHPPDRPHTGPKVCYIPI